MHRACWTASYSLLLWPGVEVSRELLVRVHRFKLGQDIHVSRLDLLTMPL